MLLENQNTIQRTLENIFAIHSNFEAFGEAACGTLPPSKQVDRAFSFFRVRALQFLVNIRVRRSLSW